MKIEELTICPAVFSCYIAKKLKNGRMSMQRKELTDNEMQEIIVWYARNKLESGHKLEFTFKDGTVVSLSHKKD